MPHQKEGNKRLWEIGELDCNQLGRLVDLMGMRKKPGEMKRWGDEVIKDRISSYRNL